MTCFAVCAPMRPLNSSVTWTSFSEIRLPSSSSSCSHTRRSPESGSITARTPNSSSSSSGSCWRRQDLYAEAMASARPSRMVVKGMPFSRSSSFSALIMSWFIASSLPSCLLRSRGPLAGSLAMCRLGRATPSGSPLARLGLRPPLEHRPRRADERVGHPPFGALRADRHRVLIRRYDRAGEREPTLLGYHRLHLYLLPDPLHEVAR